MTAQPWAVVDLAGTAVAVAALVVLHLLPTGLSPMRDPVSQYGITRYRLGYRVQTIAFGIAGIAAAVTVATGLHVPHRKATVALLVVFGLCRLVISWWPMDSPGAPTSTRGTVHLFLAVIAFLTAPIAANRLLAAVGDAASGTTTPFGAGPRTALTVAFWLMIAGLVGMFFLRRLGGRRFFGAAERLIYLGIVVLLSTIGLALA